MRYFTQVFAALAFAAILASTPAAPAWADVGADFNAAKAAHNARNYDAAIGLYTKVIQSGKLSGKNLAITYNRRGLTHAAKKDFDRAIADFNKSVEIQPNYAKAYNNLGLAYAYKRQYGPAIANFTKAIKLNPNYADAYGNRGLTYEKKGRMDAIADYRKAVRLRPNDRAGMSGLKRLRARP